MHESWTIERASREKPPVFHPLAGADFRTYWGHYRRNRPAGFDLRSRLPRAVASACSVIRAPFYIGKQLRYGRAIAARSRDLETAPPVFIVGHWRSGTTHLHNLLSRDPRFAWITLHQTGNPWSMTGPGVDLTRRLMSLVLPETRGMDEVALSLDSPQEEEMALGNMSPLCFYNTYYFPRNLREHFAESVLLENIPEARLAAFASAYRALFQRLSHANDGKRILSKNPASAARLGFLKRVFPGARFIHIVRNPREVFTSTLAHFPRVLHAFAWQRFDDIDFEEVTLENYKLLMRRYLEERARLAPGDLVETTFEKITASPLEELPRLYEALEIPFSNEARDAIAAYLDTQRDYRRNPHTLTPAQAEKVAAEWAFAFEAWGYDSKGC